MAISSILAGMTRVAARKAKRDNLYRGGSETISVGSISGFTEQVRARISAESPISYDQQTGAISVNGYSGDITIGTVVMTFNKGILTNVATT
jgi:hypothetical protein